MHEPDPEVIAAARGGDIAAFEALVRHFQADAWRLSFHLVHDRTLADDVTQDAFVRAFRFLPRYRGESKFSTWLFSIVRNCALDELRRAGRGRKLVETLGSAPAPVGVEHGRALEVRDALEKLAMELRESLVLIDVLGFPYQDAARMLSAPVGTIKSRVHRGRALLAHALGVDTEENAGDG